MDKISTKQLLDIAVEIVGLADRCHRAGLIDDWQATMSVENEDNYAFEVRVNPYMTTEVRWTASAANYSPLETDPEKEPVDLKDAELMRDHLRGLIEAARADLEAKLNILNG